jgi:hypothetical protein
VGKKTIVVLKKGLVTGCGNYMTQKNAHYEEIGNRKHEIMCNLYQEKHSLLMLWPLD